MTTQQSGRAIERAVNERGEPDLIWLQVHGEADPADYNRPPDIHADYVSWYWERLFDHDVMYVRADLAAPKQQAVAVTEEMVRRALHFCPSELSSPQKWHWIAKFITTELLAAPKQQAVDEAMSLHDRVEFALRDAGFDYDEALRIALLAAAPKQQVVTDEDVRWCRDIAGDLREAGGSTNAMRLVALERLIDAAAPKQQAVDKETLVAFERVFWKAVELSGSRDFDHDVCKEVRDFRSLLAALPGVTP